MSRIENAIRIATAGAVLTAAGIACSAPKKDSCSGVEQNPQFKQSQLNDFRNKSELSTLDLYETKEDRFLQKVGNVFQPDSPGVTHTGASIYHTDFELFNPDRAELGILTSREFANQLAGNKLIGFLVADGKHKIVIDNISTKRAGDFISPIDYTDEDNEVITATLDLSGSPYDIESIGRQELMFYVGQKDCETGEIVEGSMQVFDLKPTGFLTDTDSNSILP